MMTPTNATLEAHRFGICEGACFDERRFADYVDRMFDANEITAAERIHLLHFYAAEQASRTSYRDAEYQSCNAPLLALESKADVEEREFTKAEAAEAARLSQTLDAIAERIESAYYGWLATVHPAYAELATLKGLAPDTFKTLVTEGRLKQIARRKRIAPLIEQPPYLTEITA